MANILSRCNKDSIACDICIHLQSILARDTPLFWAFDLQGDNNPQHLKSDLDFLSAGGSSKLHRDCRDEDGVLDTVASWIHRQLLHQGGGQVQSFLPSKQSRFVSEASSLYGYHPKIDSILPMPVYSMKSCRYQLSHLLTGSYIKMCKETASNSMVS